MSRRTVLVLSLVSSACDDTTPAWDLSHDRIIAVRTSPPAVEANRTSIVDALLSIDRVVAPGSPQQVSVAPNSIVTPQLERVGDAWMVTAPDAAALATAREELGLPPDAPVGITLVMDFLLGDLSKQATKTIRFGATAENPVADIRVAGLTERAVVAVSEEVVLESTADEAELGDELDWLTTIGELTDIEDPVGHLICDEAGEGTVVVVRRDASGGVGWNSVQVEAR